MVQPGAAIVLCEMDDLEMVRIHAKDESAEMFSVLILLQENTLYLLAAKSMSPNSLTLESEGPIPLLVALPPASASQPKPASIW